MTNRGRHRRGGRVTPKGTRPSGFRPRTNDSSESVEPEAEPDVLVEIRHALAAGHPLGLLSFASSILALLDPRRRNPFDRGHDAEHVSRDELFDSFISAEHIETTALMKALALLTTDEIERRRFERAVELRHHILPEWLEALRDLDVYRTTEMVHVLGDGDNVLVGARVSTGHELTAVVYIDHNVGTLVKDAFVVPEPIADVIRYMRDRSDSDTGFTDLLPAEAKARIVEAIHTGAITYPPFETDTWPAGRPLVEWIASHLPDGGRGYEHPEWSDEDRTALVERFFGSPFASLDSPDRRDLLDTILWFGCDYGPGDPLRWSPVAVELLLADFIPRKVVADAEHLTQAPDVLREFIRYSHAERGIREHLTDETLAAVERWEPSFQKAIRSPRLQGPAALLAAVGALDPDDALLDMDDGDDDSFDVDSFLLAIYRSAVGGDEALAELDDAPLPDEPFDWSSIPDDVHERVGEVVALCDRFCDELLDVEYRTAARRVLARVARDGAHVFRRRGSADTAAAAVCLMVGFANGLFHPAPGGLTQKALQEHFGVGSSVRQRASTFHAAGRFPGEPNDGLLGSPGYLVSRRRRDIIGRVRELREPDA